MLNERCAVIDIGSNSMRLAIWEVIKPGGSYRVIDRARENVRLSEGMNESKNISPEVGIRAMAAMQVFSQMLKKYDVQNVIAVGTAALRKAENRQVFLQNVLATTGISIDVISGQQETAYSFAGVINSTSMRDFVLIDTGGGSCEIALCLNRALVDSVCLSIGCVALTEKFFSESDIKLPGEKALNAMREYVKKQLSGAAKFLARARGLPIIALGGANRALGMLSMNGKDYPLSRLHGYEMSAQELSALAAALSTTPLNKRKKMLGFDSKRADVIIAGAMPLNVLAQEIGAHSVIISETGLRDGAFFEAMYGGVQRSGAEVLRDSLENALLLYGGDLAHGRDVARICMSLFDQLAKLGDLSENMRTPLYAAAMLHDIGVGVDYDSHEIHGYYLALNSLLPGLTHAEQMQTAELIARHRAIMGKFNDDTAEYLGKAAMDKVIGAGKILRLAERLCRYDGGSIKEIECFSDDKHIQLLLHTDNHALTPMLSGLSGEKDYNSLFGRRLSIL